MSPSQIRITNEAQAEYLSFLKYYNQHILNRLAPVVRKMTFSGMVQDLKLAARLVEFYQLEEQTQKKFDALSDYESEHPFEFSKSVIIEDKDGLEKILRRTQKQEHLEWGTWLKTRVQNGIATIYHIGDSEESENDGTIIERTNTDIKWNHDHFDNIGANGMHHYHPNDKDKVGSEHFIINGRDRSNATNRIHLLSFCVNGKPEVIAYNSHRVYVPVNSSKTRLINATPKDIFDYLRNK